MAMSSRSLRSSAEGRESAGEAFFRRAPFAGTRGQCMALGEDVEPDLKEDMPWMCRHGLMAARQF